MKRKLILTLSVLLFMGAVAITAYPMIANYINDKHQSAIRIEYAQEVEALEDSEIQNAQQAAIAYNESLLPIRYDREALQAAAESYDELLDLTGSGLMGYVEIPKLELQLPIYHGTEEEVLQKGIGHLIGSSLPIGGAGFHSVLTGHSGLAGKRLFPTWSSLYREMPSSSMSSGRPWPMKSRKSTGSCPMKRSC